MNWNLESGILGASEIEEGIGVGCEEPFHIEPEELNTSTLGNVEARCIGIAVSSYLVHG